MNSLKQITWSLLIILLVGFAGCKNDSKDVEQIADEVLVSNELGTSISQLFIQSSIGLLSAQYPDAAGLTSAVKSGVNVYTITYKTTFHGVELIASGLVAVPAAGGNYPVLSFQNGTNVLYSEAPTKNYKFNPDDLENTTVVLESMASLGFVVVIPDYPGFGSSEAVFHPYLEKENTLPALTDMILAAGELLAKEELEPKLNGDLFIAGYSQGGWSTMQLLKELDQNPLDGFNLKAASCGAGPYNLSQMNSYVLAQDTYSMPYYFGYLLHAYELHGLISNPLSDLFAATYAPKIPGLFDFVTSGGAINAELTDNIDELFQADYISGFSSDSKFSTVESALAANSISAWNLSTPTMLFHGDADVYVPVEISNDFISDFRELGVNDDMISLTTITGADHTGGVLPFGLKTVAWFLSMEN
ncbi:alpha/beta hydrolase family protein [Mangrovibacterium lignilyticum]|uniref:alpha/beta hydrolase family protein n=1 Tax=Mangrovibacterium lignilyticum TaxID=2668052 RepID=UPI0013D0B1D7|nr:prolyl oligopeptidase family serine peptidase [Mangrovibacterium lignilyticum]